MIQSQSKHPYPMKDVIELNAPVQLLKRVSEFQVGIETLNFHNASQMLSSSHKVSH